MACPVHMPQEQLTLPKTLQVPVSNLQAYHFTETQQTHGVCICTGISLHGFRQNTDLEGAPTNKSHNMRSLLWI